MRRKDQLKKAAMRKSGPGFGRGPKDGRPNNTRSSTGFGSERTSINAGGTGAERNRIRVGRAKSTSRIRNY